MKNSGNFKQDALEFLNGFKTMASDLRTKGKRAKQIPNLLSLSRLGCAFVIPPLAMSGNLIAAAVVTVLALLTDAVDGKIARKLDAVSEFGKNLDPVCDKILAGSLLLPLIGSVSPLLSLGMCINLALELGIASVNLKSKAKGNVPRTSILGKVKTALLSALIASLYVSFSYQAITTIIPIIYAIATTTQAVTLLDYNRIDKKKDRQKLTEKRNNQNSDIQNPDNSDFSNTMNKSVVDYFVAKEKGQSKKTTSTTETKQTLAKNLPYDSSIYSSEDYKQLRDEIIRTKTTNMPDTKEQTTDQNGFQKQK